MEHWEKRIVLESWYNIGWQLAKERLSMRKHGNIPFADAVMVLDDKNAATEPQEKDGEEREKVVGKDSSGKLLAIAVSIHAPDEEGGSEDVGFIRIFSARLATSTERILYDRKARGLEL